MAAGGCPRVFSGYSAHLRSPIVTAIFKRNLPTDRLCKIFPHRKLKGGVQHRPPMSSGINSSASAQDFDVAPTSLGI
jgi:hypothetical protein